MAIPREKLLRAAIWIIIGISIGVGIGFFLAYNFPMAIDESTTQVITDREYYPTALDLINSADETIHITMYQMKYYTSKQYKDSPTNKLIDALIAAKERGIEVKVIIDESTNENGNAGNDLINLLRENNIIAKFDKPDTTTHAKLVIIDSKIVLVGSSNWSYFTLTKNHETNVLIKSDKVAYEFEDYFENIWKES